MEGGGSKREQDSGIFLGRIIQIKFKIWKNPQKHRRFKAKERELGIKGIFTSLRRTEMRKTVTLF